MTAEMVAKGLGGHKIGPTWMALCPAHADRTPSLAICDGDDGKLLLHCHAGCPQPSVIAALLSLGLWPEKCRRERSSFGQPQHQVSDGTTADEGGWLWSLLGASES